MGALTQRPLRYLVCGSRDWQKRLTIGSLIMDCVKLIGTDYLTIVHGDCPTGADMIADEVCEALGVRHERHHANWNRYGRAAGPIRNAEMIASGVDLLYVFKDGFDKTLSRGGSEDCVRQAQEAGIDCFWFHSESRAGPFLLQRKDDMRGRS